MAEDRDRDNQARYGENPLDHLRREFRSEMRDFRSDLKEAIKEVRDTVSARIGEIERAVGELRAGKADKEEVQQIAKQKASKLAETIIYGLCALVLTGAVGAVLALIYVKP